VNQEVLFEEGLLRVVRRDGVVRLEYGGEENVYSVYDEKKLFCGGYWDYVSCLIYLAGEVSDVLLVGLGGGTIVRQLLELFSPRIDVVEVDARMPALAERFFGLKANAKVAVFGGDAASYLAESGRRYDVIVLDAFVGDRMPEGVNSMEFFALCAAHLRDGGILIVNSVRDEQHRDETETLIKNIRENFASSYTTAYSDNVIYAAFKRHVTAHQVTETLGRIIDARLAPTRDKILDNLK
jgi:spermidine synthase